MSTSPTGNEAPQEDRLDRSEEGDDDCEVCRKFLHKGGITDGPRTLIETKESALRGCDDCWAASCAIEQFFLRDSGLPCSGHEEVLVRYFALQEPSIYVKIPDGVPAKARNIYFYRTPLAACSSAATLVPTSEHVSADARSPAAQALMSKWLHSCMSLTSDHEHCKHLSGSIKLPTRTISLGPSNDAIFLSQNSRHMSESSSTVPAYACLSHCWGNYQPLRLTKENSASLQANIPWSSFPATFQDAITVCRALGISHLWIDSLCIIQDDHNDWATESSRMGGIYAGGEVTIAALASEDCRGGLFRDRGALHVDTFQIPSRTSKLLDSAVSLWARLEKHENLNLPLPRRAWAFQEWQLSPRVLCFGRFEIAWRCQSLRACECGAYGPLTSIFNTASEWDDEWDWDQIVCSYSELNLTREDDILPALSGIASAYRSRVGLAPGDYLAGLWRGDDFVGQLRWFKYSTQTQRAEKYRAPSWSWASSLRMRANDNDSISFLDDIRRGPAFDCMIEAKLANARCSLLTSNPFGEVTGGYITLCTLILRSRLQCNVHEGATGSFDYTLSGDLELVGNTWQERAEMQLDVANITFSAGTCFSGEAIWTFMDYSYGDEAEVFCAVLWWMRYREGIKEHDHNASELKMMPRIAGQSEAVLLLLEKCEGGEETFRRIGITAMRIKLDEQFEAIEEYLEDYLSTITIV